jgi:hypothetical protein
MRNFINIENKEQLFRHSILIGGNKQHSFVIIFKFN